ncbi:DUF1573 domain-containing protein [Candidatus Poribacteria bacterium]
MSNISDTTRLGDGHDHVGAASVTERSAMRGITVVLRIGIALTILWCIICFGARGENAEEITGPVLSVSEEIWDFGIIKQGEVVKHTFKLKNTGNNDLIIDKVRTTCGCTAVMLSSKNIPSGGSSELEVEFNSEDFEEDVQRSVYIQSNDVRKPNRQLKITAHVEPPPKSDRPAIALKPRKEIRISGYKSELGTGSPVGSSTKPVRMLIFHMEDCEDCEHIRDYMLPQLEKKYSILLEARYLEITEAGNYDTLLDMERQYGDEGNDLPVIFIGKHVLGGIEEIDEELDDMVRDYAFQGGTDWPALDASPQEPVDRESAGRIYLAMFDKPGCKNCARVEHILANLERKYSGLVIKKFMNSRREDVLIHEAMCELMQVPRDKRLIAPTIFIGDDYLVKDEITDSKVDSLIRKYVDADRPPPWQAAMQNKGKASDRIIERFKSFGIFAVIGAGLVDGINPCAFATIVFFISYLTFIERKGKEILIIGGAFTFSVFLTYFLVGLGVFRFIESLNGFSVIGRVLYIIIAILALAFGMFSLYDYYKFRQGKVKDMKLQLPKIVKNRIYKVIRGNVKIRSLMLGAIVTGCLVSLLELACTGQMYLPTIAFVTGVPELRANAIFSLLIYNLMFVLPLIIIFVSSFYGASSQRLGRILQRRLGQVKILTGVFFIGLGILLIFTSVYLPVG